MSCRAFLAMLPTFIAALRVDPPTFPPALRINEPRKPDGGGWHTTFAADGRAKFANGT